jgi:hypothetical protein
VEENVIQSNFCPWWVCTTGTQRGYEFDSGSGEPLGDPLAISRSIGVAPAAFAASVKRAAGLEKLSFGQ